MNKRLEMSGLMFALIAIVVLVIRIIPVEVLEALDGNVSPREAFPYLQGIVTCALAGVGWIIIRKCVE